MILIDEKDFNIVMALFLGDFGMVVAPPGSAMVNYVTAGFAAMFAVLCIIIIIVCSVQLKRYKRNG